MFKLIREIHCLCVSPSQTPEQFVWVFFIKINLYKELKMNDLYNLILDFEDKLQEENTIVSLKEQYKIIKNDSELVNLIKKYHQTSDEAIKEKLIMNDKLRKAKHLENELNYIILQINKELSVLTNKRSCNK